MTENDTRCVVWRDGQGLHGKGLASLHYQLARACPRYPQKPDKYATRRSRTAGETCANQSDATLAWILRTRYDAGLRLAPRADSRNEMNNWDVLPAPEKGDPTREALYAAIGEALTEWEKLVGDLAEIYSILVGAPEMTPGEGPEIQNFGELSFKAQCDNLKTAAAAFFPQHPPDPKLQSIFDDLLNQCSNARHRRNDIAHGTCELVAGKGYLCLPTPYNPKKVQSDWTMAYAFSSKEILFYANQFRQLRDLVGHLNGALYLL